MYLSEILSSFICGKPDFDPQVRYLAKRSIVDTMGAMLAGSCTDVVKQLLPVYNAPGCCTLVGLKGTVSANNAAFLNGISGHELELDDTSSHVTRNVKIRSGSTSLSMILAFSNSGC